MRPLFIAAAAALAVAGCAHTPKPVEAAPPAPAPAPPPAAPAPVAAAPAACTADRDCADGSLCLHGACVVITADLSECADTRVHFDFNESLIKPADEATLQRMARCLRAASKLHVTIEGNADERGTEEYNMALGAKRASAVEHYLEVLGASRTQLDTISYGYEKPVCSEHNEACWAKNRRAALKPEEASAPAPAPKKK